MKINFNPYWEVIIASIIFGTGGVFIKYINLPPTSVAFFRMAIPTIVVAGWMRYTQKEFWRQGETKTLLLLSSLNVVRMYLYFVGFTMTSIGNAVISLYTSPIFIMLFAVRLLGEKMNIVRYGSMILAIVGLVVIGYGKGLSLHQGDIIGILAIVLSSFIQGYITVLMKTSLRTYDKVSLIFYQCLIAAIIFLPFVFVNHPLPSIGQIGVSTVYALLIGIVGFILYFSALKQVDATVVSMITYLEMVSSIIFAWIFFGDQITFPLFIGALCIIVSGMSLISEQRIISFLGKKGG